MSTTVYLDKRVSWVRTYEFDFSPFAELAAGETLSSPSVTSTPSGLTVGTPAVVGALVEATVSGGVAATDYSLTATAHTSGGAVLTVTGGLSVVA